jgi:hypothetical protein
MNRLPLATRTQVINCLVEGNSIRSTERMCDVHRDTICRLLVEVGEGCQHIMDEKMRYLTCGRLQVDEIWCLATRTLWVGRSGVGLSVRLYSYVGVIDAFHGLGHGLVIGGDL